MLSANEIHDALARMQDFEEFERLIRYAPNDAEGRAVEAELLVPHAFIKLVVSLHSEHGFGFGVREKAVAAPAPAPAPVVAPAAQT